MAETEGRKGGKLNFRKPGMLEYAVIGGVVLAGIALVAWWKNRNASSSGGSPSSVSADGAPYTGASSPTGLSPDALLAWLRDHMSSSSPPGPAGPPGPPGPTGPPVHKGGGGDPHGPPVHTGPPVIGRTHRPPARHSPPIKSWPGG